MVAIRYADAPLASRAHWFYSGTKMKPTGRSDRLVAPTLLRYEIGSVCLKKLRAYPGQRQGLLEALSLLERLEFEELPVVVDEVVTLARRHRITAYDASYVWLALTLGAEFITLDRTLGRVWKRASPHPW